MLLKMFVFLGAALFALPSLAEVDVVEGMAKPWQLNYQDAVTPVMERLSSLHDAITLTVAIVTLFVTLLLAYVCVRFRRSRNPVPSKTSHNTLIEVIWTTVPIIILAGISIPSIKLHYYMDKAQDPELTLKVTGYQWYWGYSYPDQEVDEYLSYMKEEDELQAGEPRLLSVDNPLVVPVDTTVRVLLTGADVIHSFAMPSFGVKTDCIPGRLNETWFKVTKPGIYYGQCSELCGRKHGFMPIEIRAVEKDVFEQWVGRAKEGDYALDGLNIPTNSQVATIELQPTPVNAQ